MEKWWQQALVWHSPLTVPFRGLTSRDGMLLQGELGWGEFSPFWDYDQLAAARWLESAYEQANLGWPNPVRAAVPVNVTVPAVTGEVAAKLVQQGDGCRTAKVKVAQKVATPAGELQPESLDLEVARIAAVRQALDQMFGKGVGKIRVDANGAWTVPQAVAHLRELNQIAGDLEYAEQPCATVEELAELRQALHRAGIPVPIAADESIRRASDPYRVKALDAADIVVLKVAPLGGVRACLVLAENIGLPVVVSSALESSIGLAAGLALAGALPELLYACGLATSSLLVTDTIATPLTPHGGALPVLPANHPRLKPVVEPVEITMNPDAAQLTSRWQHRLAQVLPVGRVIA